MKKTKFEKIETSDEIFKINFEVSSKEYEK